MKSPANSKQWSWKIKATSKNVFEYRTEHLMRPNKKTGNRIQVGFLTQKGVRSLLISAKRLPNFLFSSKSQPAFLIARFLMRGPVLLLWCMFEYTRYAYASNVNMSMTCGCGLPGINSGFNVNELYLQSRSIIRLSVDYFRNGCKYRIRKTSWPRYSETRQAFAIGLLDLETEKTIC